MVSVCCPLVMLLKCVSCRATSRGYLCRMSLKIHLGGFSWLRRTVWHTASMSVADSKEKGPGPSDDANPRLTADSWIKEHAISTRPIPEKQVVRGAPFAKLSLNTSHSLESPVLSFNA
eukprot:9493603-Pyramimonas_sp.AAC.1